MTDQKTEQKNSKFMQIIEKAEGKVGVPILMYILGVPGFVCILVWAFFFRGK